MERVWFVPKKKIVKSPLKEATKSEKTFEQIFGGKGYDNKGKEDKRDR